MLAGLVLGAQECGTQFHYCEIGYTLKKRVEMQRCYRSNGPGVCVWVMDWAIAALVAVIFCSVAPSLAQGQMRAEQLTWAERHLQQQNRLNEALKNRIDQLKQRLSADECAILREQGGNACLVPNPLVEFNKPVAPSSPPSAVLPYGISPVDALGSTNSLGAIDPKPEGQLEAAETEKAAPMVARPAKPLSNQEMLALLENVSVFVVTSKGLGSGFFVGSGLLLTNKHVVGNETRIMITSAALGRPFEARVVKQSPAPVEVGHADFALLRVDELTDNPIALIAAGTSKLGGVIAAGYPGLVVSNDQALARLGSGDLSAAPDLVVSRGEISAIQQPGGIQTNSLETLVHTARIMAGNSGGPLFDDCGRVVGINTFITADSGQASSAGFALGPAALRDFLHGVPGVRLAPATPCGS